MFEHHVCACEREFIKKGAQAFWNVDYWAIWSKMIGAWKIALPKAGKSTFNHRGAVAIIAEDPRQFCVNSPGSEPFHPQKIGHDSLFGFFHKVTLTYKHWTIT
jgi:hypothetical protein